MPLANTRQHFGAVTKTFHWLTALLILTAIPLGIVASRLPHDTAEQLAWKAQLFSLHKTAGVAAFAVALLRILWALTQPKPVPLHPGRRLETLLAEAVHWALYAALVVVPLSGWIHHAATSGFAPILWPFGQTLPLVPRSDGLAAVAGAMHWVFTKVLIASLLLHLLGALKHLIHDRDATLARMLPGTPALAPVADRPRSHARPALLAAAVYLCGAGVALGIAPGSDAPLAPRTPAAAATGNWQVVEGEISLTVRAFGSDVTGRFHDWSSEIAFSESPVDGTHGSVRVTVAIAALSLGSVTDEALGADYFDASGFPRAVFAADILPAATGYVAEGTLTLKGTTVPVSLPFELAIDADTATMAGQVTLDRRDFGIGTNQTDEGTLAFPVLIDVALNATRATP